MKFVWLAVLICWRIYLWVVDMQRRIQSLTALAWWNLDWKAWQARAKCDQQTSSTWVPGDNHLCRQMANN